ncbi:hypothetical protein PIIN_00377 [Serendipita indica DSM 11827]|uniref:DUF6535 domain-containing protein n=1 Tax=Serendipita indica (strain DSM 11827) TaxID=1109443 RepID=G4T5U2_SERID|nr:hypothetical protein PIIN_00377 [Serendipita indica DSM 11827]
MSTQRKRGLFRKPKRDHLATPIKTETGKKSVWEHYNERAETVDRELVRDSNDSLNTLLIFAALFSAILTAFIVESMKLLEEDPAETSRDILLTLSRQLANNSLPAYSSSGTKEFTPPAFAVRVNSYFFASISCSLVAALGAVLALQWIGSYDVGLNATSAEGRALQRQMRWEGISNWKMREIISAFPVLLYVALLMFLVGLAEWLWHLNRSVAATVISGLLVATTLFAATTIVEYFDVFSPFHTPVSQLFAYFAVTARNMVRRFVLRRQLDPEPPTFRERERHQVQRQHEHAYSNSILWLTEQTENVTSSRPQFLAVVEEFLSKSYLWFQMPTPAILPGYQWGAVLNIILSPYYNFDVSGDLNDEDTSDFLAVTRALIYLPQNISRQAYMAYFMLSKLSRSQKSPLGLLIKLLLVIGNSSTHSGSETTDLLEVVELAEELEVSIIFDLNQSVTLRLLQCLDLGAMSTIIGLCRLLRPFDLRGKQKKDWVLIKNLTILDALMDIAESQAGTSYSPGHLTICIVLALQRLAGSDYPWTEITKFERVIKLFKVYPEVAISQRRHIYAILLQIDLQYKDALQLLHMTLGLNHQYDMIKDVSRLWVDIVEAADEVVSSSPGRYYREDLIGLIMHSYPREVLVQDRAIHLGPHAFKDRTLALVCSIFGLYSNFNLWEELEGVSHIVWKDSTWIRAVKIWFRDFRHLEQGVLKEETRKMMVQTLEYGPYQLFGSLVLPLLDMIRYTTPEIEIITKFICHPRMLSCDIFAEAWESRLEIRPSILSDILCCLRNSPALPSRLKDARVERYIITLSRMGDFTPLFKLLQHCIQESPDLRILHWYIKLAYIPLEPDILKEPRSAWAIALGETQTNLRLSTESLDIIGGPFHPLRLRMEHVDSIRGEQHVDSVIWDDIESDAVEVRVGVYGMVQKSMEVYGRWSSSISEPEKEHWQRILDDIKEIERGAKRGYIAVISPPGAGCFRDPDGLCSRSIM